MKSFPVLLHMSYLKSCRLNILIESIYKIEYLTGTNFRDVKKIVMENLSEKSKLLLEATTEKYIESFTAKKVLHSICKT